MPTPLSPDTYSQLMKLINLTYRDKVESITAAQINDSGDIIAVGLDGQKKLAIKIAEDSIAIKLMGESAAFAKASPKAPRKKTCKRENISCGFTCISGKKICRIGMTLEQQRAYKQLRKEARQAKRVPNKLSAIDKTISEIMTLINEGVAVKTALDEARLKTMTSMAEEWEESHAKYKEAQDKAEKFAENILRKVSEFEGQLRAGVTEEKALDIIKGSGIKYPRKRLPELIDLVRVVGFVPSTLKEIKTTSRKRAYADRTEGIVALSRNSPKQVLWHEVGHHVEYSDPLAFQAAEEWRNGKATGSLISLRRLTGMNYRADEVAVPDHFVTPYVGKVYRWNSTEVTSVGIEQLSSPEGIIEMLAKDPSHMKFILKEVLKK